MNTFIRMLPMILAVSGGVIVYYAALRKPKKPKK
jgi:hypothetical protein